jgi:glycosyltransferase involved in cell wall biosynthesis
MRASLIVPARNEVEFINTFLERLSENVSSLVEVLIIVDDRNDLTLSAIRSIPYKNLDIRKLVSTYGPGPANAIKFGFAAARTNIAIVTMADGSDDPKIIDDLILLVERGCAVVAASRYMPGGQQIGGLWFKKKLSRNSSRILKTFARIATHDATNSFKAYSIPFVKSVGIHSNKGFAMGLELTVKAHRSKLLIAELPTIWIDRSLGESSFQMRKWIPQYLRWFFYAFGIKTFARIGKLK